jgi:V/A-type H+-transporting ATPase subunit C
VVNPVKEGASPHFREGRVRGLPQYLAVGLRRIKPFHDATKYGYAVGRVRVWETQLLNTQRLERLIEADFEGALNILDEVAMGDYLAKARLARDVDAGLTAFLRDLYSTLKEALPENSYLMDFFLCRYDFHNLKALMKSLVEGKEPEALLEGFGVIDHAALKRGLENPELLPSPYREAVQEFQARKPQAQELDTLLDRHYLAYRLFLARREGSPYLVDFARACIDLANLKGLIRARGLGKSKEFLADALVAGGFITTGYLLDLYGDAPEVMAKKLETTSYHSRLLELSGEKKEPYGLTDFDRLSDDYLMELVRGSRRVAVGPEPIFAYVRARENEVMMVRMILMAKLHNIAPADIEKMMRKLYIE